MINHDRGRTFSIIRDVLTKELGYHIDFRVIDAKPFLPQHTRTNFYSRVLLGEESEFTFDTLNLPDPHFWPKLGKDPSTWAMTQKGQSIPIHHWERRHISDKYTLSQHLWTYLQNYAEKHQQAGNGFGFGLFGPDDVARTLSARYYKDGSEILVRQGGQPPRRLTPRECARLMGFDAPGRSDFRIPVSDTQAYQQLGNSVAVPVVIAVARHIRHTSEGY